MHDARPIGRTDATADQIGQIRELRQQAPHKRGEPPTRLAGLAPDRLDNVFYNNGGADPNEKAIPIAIPAAMIRNDSTITIPTVVAGDAGAV